MTRHDPSLRLSRLVVYQQTHVAYDEQFHLGVNIIRGSKNSVGKSTIVNMIFYVLGGEAVNWVEEAKACTHVVAEVYVNGVPITLQRDISSEKERPMQIFWGGFEKASMAGPALWERYPFSRHANAQTFSQVLFAAMGIPEVKGELASALTMNQLLRLMFADQSTPPHEMYRAEQFSKKDTLEAVGDLLCGIYDDAIYEIGIALKLKENERAELKGELKSLWRILGTSDQASGLQTLRALLDTARVDLSGEYKKLELLRAVNNNATETTTEKSPERELEKSVAGLREELFNEERELETLAFEIEDSALFIKVLEENRESLNDSEIVRHSLGEASFHRCPACLTLLHEVVVGLCPLCKEQRSPEKSASELLRLRNELAQQLKESLQLQENRRKRQLALTASIRDGRRRLQTLEEQYADMRKRVASESEIKISESYRAVGYLTRKVEDLEKQVELASAIDKLIERVSVLSAEITRLTEERARRNAAQAKNREDAYTTIAHITRELVMRDLPVEAAFQRPDAVDFSFRDNVVRVEGRSNYSASSKVILKNSFHLAILLASTEKSLFRYPRLALFDDIEEGGMTADRSQNFQRLIVERSTACQSEHQIIFSTSMVDAGLNESELTVGRYYTPEDKSLRLAGRVA
jgi:hypothetical protein